MPVQVTQNPSLVGEGCHEIPALAKELLKIGSCVEKEKDFFVKGVTPDSYTKYDWMTVHQKVYKEY